MRPMARAAMCVAIAIGAAAAAVAAGQVLADVGGDRISREEFLEAVAGMRRQGDLQLTIKTLTREGHREILDDLIEKRLYAAAARAEGLHKQPGVQRAIEQAANEILAHHYLDVRITSAEVADTELRAFYEKNKNTLIRPAQVKARHIVVKTPDEAHSIIKRLRGGADFAAVAAEVSLEAATRAKGGDLGWVPRGVMTKPFEDAIFALAVGQISDPIETPYGVHVVKVEETQQPALPAFELVRDDIRTRILQQRREQLKQQLASKIGVTINQAALDALSPK
ncbi:MAG TPA: peptidylprolyl isomerase [Vicinamibacterales bacterium]|nr:peptidylprolyl isomerase [Vicinamibacterales bacterium]